MDDDDIQPILSHELEALRALPPWRDMDADLLAGILPRAELCFFARGALILHADLEPPAGLVVRDGHVDVYDADRREGPPLLQLPPGALLPLLPGTAVRLAYVATVDLYCWRIATAEWEPLRDQPTLLRWRLAGAAEVLRALQTRRRDEDHAAHAALAMMALPVGHLPLPSLGVSPDTSLAEAAALLGDRHLDALAVLRSGAPPDILTETQLLRQMAEGRDPATPVGGILPPAAHAIAASTTVAEAAQDMCARHVHHLAVTDDAGAFAGLLSAEALFRLQRSGFGYFASPIEQAHDLDELAAAVADMRAFAARLFAGGAGAAPLTAVISALNDQVVRRVLRLAGDEALADLHYCWLAFGSEGRHEQTLSTDQDNGILFHAAAGDPQPQRDRLLEFAERVNTGLDHCGFPLCKGNIMARNPRWCLSLDEWRDQFSSWIRAPGPEALLNANIFFDFNPVFGDAALADALRHHLFSLSRGNSIFLAMMSENALRVGPPLGAFGRFSTDGGENAGTIDLKRQGSRLFVDAGRVCALAHGICATHTGERLRLGGLALRRESRMVAADVAAFNVLLGIRMGNQLRHDPADARDPNRVDPHALNDIDQRVLREALHQAQHLQERIKLEYSA